MMADAVFSAAEVFSLIPAAFSSPICFWFLHHFDVASLPASLLAYVAFADVVFVAVAVVVSLAAVAVA